MRGWLKVAGIALAAVWSAGPAPGAPLGQSISFSLVERPGPQGIAFGLEHAAPRLSPSAAVGDVRAQTAVARLPSRKNELRAWIEFGTFSTVSTVNYWLSNSFPEDRDFSLTLDDQFGRIFLLKGWRFDSNQFSLNWSHIMAGAVYYQFARTNGLSGLSSWLMALAGSTWWEVVGEPKEVIAINDQIMTGLGGLATGEPWYQIGHFLSHQRGALARGLSFANPAVKLNHWLDRKAADVYEQPAWHDFSLFAGMRRLASDAGIGTAAGIDAYFGLHARLRSFPQPGDAGRTRQIIKDTYFSEISFDLATRGGHAEETRLQTKAVILGWLVQDVQRSGSSDSVTIGLGSAFEYFKKRPLASYDSVPVPVRTGFEGLSLEEPRRFTDKLAILHVAGPVADWIISRRDLSFWAGLEAYADFALVNALALNDYSLTHPVTGLKTTVFYYGYYYGFGGTASARARLDWKGFRAEAQASIGAWGSADVLDRFQAEIANNAHLSDGRTRLAAGAGWRIPGTPIEVFAEIERVARSGRLAETRSRQVDKKFYAGLAFSF